MKVLQGASSFSLAVLLVGTAMAVSFVLPVPAHAASATRWEAPSAHTEKPQQPARD